MATTTSLAKKFHDEVMPVLTKQFGYTTRMAVPKVAKIVVNMGVGEAVSDPKLLDHAVNELATIVGQRPAIRRARKSIANFKLREGMPIACTATLRGRRMYEFLDRLLNLALPRVRDFRGVSPKSFDGRGNYTLGIREHLIFPELPMAKVQKVKGMNICIVTTAQTDEEARVLLRGLGMPFSK